LVTQKFIHNIDINFRVCEAKFVNKPLKEFIKEKKDKKHNRLGMIKFKK
jgi:hypothetical protein